MKYSIIFLIIILSFLINNNIYSQETWEDDSVWVAERNAIINEINNIFSNLDKNKLATGFLYDRVPLPVSGIDKYNGTSDSLIDNNTWLQMHYELTRYATSNPELFISTLELDSIIRSYNNIVPLGIISLEYDKIKEEAIDSGWLYVENNQLI